jgi:tetratricopeptide (TPR) repeat protein/class 3 adenylate cyclase/TolB-like protein
MSRELEHLPSGNGVAQPDSDGSTILQAPPMEIAHVLFTDIVGYSKLPMDEQQRQLRRLQVLVRETPEFTRARSQDQLISLPTGDGMALVFFGEPESAARCALQLGQQLHKEPEIRLRMGVNSGPVYRVADINANRNVAGGGINIAQRVMDCGDAGHILVSKAVADVLLQLSTWQGRLQDLGQTEVKHGVCVHVFNLTTTEAGNPATPTKFLPEKAAGISARVLGGKKKLIISVAVLAACVAVAIIVSRPNLSVVHARRPKIAVLGFKNLTSTPENDWVSTSLNSMLSAELTAGDHLVTVPGETVARARVDLGLPDADSYGPETLARVRKMLDCDYVVYGSFFDTGPKSGGRLQVQYHLQKTDSAEMVASAPQAGNEIAINELASMIGASLRGRLGLPGISTSESQQIEASIPSTPEARVFYAKGLAQMRTLDLLGARESFEQAIAADPNFSLAHAELAEVWTGLGYDEKAKAQAQMAFDLSGHLGNEDRTNVEARYREMNSEWEKAIDLYRSLWIVGRKQTPEYAYRAAEVQIRAGKGADALGTVAALRKQGGDLAQSPVIDLREAEAYESLGDPREAAAAAKVAAEKAHGMGARLLESEALWRECGALAALGDTSNATGACDRSVEIAKVLGSKLLVARALTNLGNIASNSGDYAKALALHQQALQIARVLGAERDVVGALTNIADALANQGDHGQAQKNYQTAMRVANTIEDRSAILKLQNDLAGENETTGNFAKALEYFQQSLATAQSNGDRSGIVDAQTNIGSLKALRGDLAGGLTMVQQALTQSDELGLQDKSVQLQLIIGDILVRQGDFERAENSYHQALERSEKLGDAALKAASQLALGNLALENRNAPDAERLATEAAAAFHAAPNTDMECSALLVRATALMELKKYGEAEAALADAEKLKPQDRETQLTVALTWGRLQARQGKFALARNRFGSLGREAAKIGLREMEYRVALAEGELGLLEGSKKSAKIKLHQLEKEARSSGYHGIEKRAQALQGEV